MFGWRKRTQVLITKKFWSVSGGGGGKTPRRGRRPLLLHQGLRPWTRSLPPYTPSIPIYTRPSQISGSGFSCPCVHSLCRTLRTELYKKAYANPAYFFTPSLHNRLLFLIQLYINYEIISNLQRIKTTFRKSCKKMFCNLIMYSFG